MNINEYSKDPRYWAVWKKMQLLDIRDVSTDRQDNNGTIVWRLPIKNNWKNGKLIEVASFSTGYVRNQNSGYSNYQLNKRCESEPQYYKCKNKHDGSDLYRKYTTRTCRLIPIEIDRLEYLITYCLKNYYIKRANQVADGKYVSKWEHEYKLKQADNFDCGHYNRINDLEAKLKKVTRECNQAYDCGLSDGEKKANETYSENTGAMERIDDLECKIVELKSQLNHNHDFAQNVVKEKKDMLFSYELTLTENKELESKVRDLENKLATIERIARINASYR